MFLCVIVIGLHVGAFGPPLRPPGMVFGDAIHRIVPTTDPSFLTCTDPTEDTVHHFLHLDFHLTQCLWAGSPSHSTKAIIFETIRNWTANAGITVTPNFTNVCDLDAWYEFY